MTEKELAEMLGREGLTEEDVPEALRRESNRRRGNAVCEVYGRIRALVEENRAGPPLQDVLAEVDPRVLENVVWLFASSAMQGEAEVKRLEAELGELREEALT